MKDDKFIGYCTRNGTVTREILYLLEFYSEQSSLVCVRREEYGAGKRTFVRSSHQATLLFSLTSFHAAP